MKRIYSNLFFPLTLAVLMGCSVNSSEDEGALAGIAGSEDAQVSEERCATMKVLEEKIKENPGLLKKMEAIEAHTQRFVLSQGTKTNGQPASGGDITTNAVNDAGATIEIPVVVNVLYNTSLQNISDDQIKSQIKVLNLDFRKLNSDISKTMAFDGVKSDLNYHFTLKNVVRKATSKTSWGTRDAMKSARKGGIDPTSPATTLNIWVCNIGGGILGYAQFPGGSLSTDGIVVGPEYFGDKTYMPSTATAFLAAPYDKGRTATHEIGHWMNLRHIWGDATCGTDSVLDTPTHNTSNGGCPSEGHQSTCAGLPVEMTMNYMDYTFDACMYMFSEGQKTRTRAVFASNGPRTGFYATTTTTTAR